MKCYNNRPNNNISGTVSQAIEHCLCLSNTINERDAECRPLTLLSSNLEQRVKFIAKAKVFLAVDLKKENSSIISNDQFHFTICHPSNCFCHHQH